MIKKVLIVFAALFLIVPKVTHAQEKEFTNNITASYVIDPEGYTQVIYNIELINRLTNLYATSYSLSLKGINPTDPKATYQDREISIDTHSDVESYNLKVDFPDSVVGKGSSRKFTISYTDKSIAQKAGEIWEIFIPKLENPDNFDDYSIAIIVPQSFGEAAYISPNAKSIARQNGQIFYSLGKEQISKTGVNLAFGKFQVFSFELRYHLENPLAKPAKTEIAVPPDTAYQKVFYTSIDPEPVDIRLDPDGNWLAVYSLKSRERIDVIVKGYVQIFPAPKKREFLTPEEIKKYTEPTQYWQTNDPLIKGLSSEHKKPLDIYNYVYMTLDYNFDRVKPTTERLGASNALLNPGEAICTEYTDTFIALARGAGIPAREINGFAYTENPTLQPLSLVADVLHSWPEFWDADKKTWIQIDPTWASTTKGEDFFNKLDLRHFTFVIHGEDPVKPYPAGSYKLGANPQKDVFVNFAKMPETRPENIELRITQKYLSFGKYNYSLLIKSQGPSAVENETLEIFFDDKRVLSEPIGNLLPFSSFTYDFNVPLGILGYNTPNNISVFYAGENIKVPTNKDMVIVISLAIILTATLVVALLVYFRFIKDGNVFRKVFNRKKKSS